MTPNYLYDSMSMMRYQMSVLSLAAALDERATSGPKIDSQGALCEAEQLKHMMELRGM
jgi:hypothetical protein